MERLIDARVEPEVGRHPGLVAHADDGKIRISMEDRCTEIANHRIVTAVPCVGAHIDALTHAVASEQVHCMALIEIIDRKSTRLNSSHLGISYAVFCLKKNK